MLISPRKIPHLIILHIPITELLLNILQLARNIHFLRLEVRPIPVRQNFDVKFKWKVYLLALLKVRLHFLAVIQI